MTNPVLLALPELEPDESLFIQQLVGDFSDAELQQFAAMYRAQRKEPQMVMICALLGLVAVAGVHRFILGQIGMGILYVFTAGFCFIGTIIDVVNHKKLAFEFNTKQARQIIGIMQTSV